MTFSSIELLLQHVNNVHKNAGPSRDSKVPEPVPVDIPCKCKLRSCSGAEFSNMKKLITHLRNYHVGQVIECIFEHCNKSFNNANSLRLHFSLKHQKLNLCSLKAVHKIGEAHKIYPGQVVIEEEPEMNDSVVSEENMDVMLPSEEYESEGNVDEENPEFFLMAYCDFMNRLSNFQLVQQSTIKIIGEEFLRNYKRSNEGKSASLRKSLEQIPNISESDIQKVIDDVTKEDPFLEAQSQLNSEYKRTQFIKEKFSFVAP